MLSPLKLSTEFFRARIKYYFSIISCESKREHKIREVYSFPDEWYTMKQFIEMTERNCSARGYEQEVKRHNNYEIKGRTRFARRSSLQLLERCLLILPHCRDASRIVANYETSCLRWDVSCLTKNCHQHTLGHDETAEFPRFFWSALSPSTTQLMLC